MTSQIQIALFLHLHKPYRMPKDDVAKAVEYAASEVARMLEERKKAACHLFAPGQLLSLLPNSLVLDLATHAKAENLEILSGGYYDPILPLFSEEDCRAQIRMQNQWIEDRMEVRPRGIWLTHYAWSPSLLSCFQDCGLEYTVLSRKQMFDPVFPDTAYGYWVTEEKGIPFRIVPAQGDLSEAILASSPTEKSVATLTQLGTEDGERLVALDVPLSLERKAIPKLKTILGRLEKLLALCENHAFPLRWTTSGAYMDSYRPRGQTYVLPSCNPELVGKKRGAHSHLLLLQNPEAQWLQKRVFRLSETIRKNIQTEKKREQLLQDLFVCQNVHLYADSGKDYGIRYLGDRSWAFRRILEIEGKLTDESKQKDVRLEIADLKKDGNPCLFVSSRKLNAFIEHRCGGRIFELDYRPVLLPFANAWTRKKKAGAMRPDWHTKGCLVDHFFSANTRMQDLQNASFKEEGYFVTRPYEYKIGKSNTGMKIVLSHTGAVRRREQRVPVRIEKVLVVDENRPQINIAYQVSNTGLLPLEAWFGVEFNFTFGTDDTKHQHMYVSKKEKMSPRFPFEYAEANTLVFEDAKEKVKAQLTINRPTDFWCVPQFSQSGDGKKDLFQGLLVMPNWKIKLQESGSWGFTGHLSWSHGTRLMKRKHDEI